MKFILILVFCFGAISYAQQMPSGIETDDEFAVKYVYITDEQNNMHWISDGNSAIPNNAIHVANIEGTCLTGNKNCRYLLKVWKIQ